MNTIIKKVLLCAYACEPNKGSEPGVGWDTANYLAAKDSGRNYYVVTRKNNQQVIEKEETPMNLHFIYYDLPLLFVYLKRKGNFVRIYYYLWMLGAVIKLWKRRRQFQIIHHITFVNDWLPSLFILLKSKENYFVWGSIGSNNPIDRKFLNSFNENVVEKAKIFLLFIFRKLDFFYWVCVKNSDVIIGINDNVKDKIQLSDKHKRKFLSIPAIAIKNSLFRGNEFKKKERNKFVIISVGKLISIKNFILSLTVFSNFLKLLPELERRNIVLQIIGKGKQGKQLIEYSKKLGIEKNIVFKGQLPQNEVMNCFQESDLFLFPTLESAGFVILEAMSYDLPVVALDYGGPKQFIKENKEYQLVSSDISIEEIEHQLSQKIFELYNDSELREKIGSINHNTVVENFTWEQKTESIIEIYKELTQNKN